MASKSGDRLRALNAKRAVTVRTLKRSEKGTTDTQRLKREAEAKVAAGMWTKGYDAEKRLK